MIETIRRDVIQRSKLIKSVVEAHQFTSTYKDFPDKSFRTTSWRVIRTHEKYGYKVVREFSKGMPSGIDVAYTLDNQYIGLPKDAEHLCKKRGISLEKADPNHCCCSIGKCTNLPSDHPDSGKWFGWSHRAIFGFKVGDGYTVKDGDVLAGDYPIGYQAQTEEDCKQMAKAFARAVS